MSATTMSRDHTLSWLQALHMLEKTSADNLVGVDVGTFVLFLAMVVKSSPHLKGEVSMVSYISICYFLRSVNVFLSLRFCNARSYLNFLTFRNIKKEIPTVGLETLSNSFVSLLMKTA